MKSINTLMGTSYQVQMITEHPDGKTTDIKQYDCETLQEALTFIEEERFFFDEYKVYVWMHDLNTGEVIQGLLL